MLEVVENGQGLELLRKLNRKFDPLSPNMKQHIQEKLYALRNMKCQDVAAVTDLGLWRQRQARSIQV